MAEIQDVMIEDQEIEQSEIEAVEKQQNPQANEDDDLPEEYKGKSRKELVKIAQDRNAMIGKQAQEVGEVRRLADELLKSQLHKKPEVEEKIQEVDFFENPQEAMRQAVANSPDVKQAKQMALQMQQERAMSLLVSKHPDKDEILQDGEFTNFVKGSRIRTELFNRAHSNYDFEAADELLSTFKQLKAAKQQQTTSAVTEVEKQARNKSLQAASVDAGGSGESSKKTYSRIKLLKMQIHNPSEYASLADSGELALAYQQGRVVR